MLSRTDYPAFEPTFLRQGSCLMAFHTLEAAQEAYKACLGAFHTDQRFAGFTLRPPINTPDWMMAGHQPCKPWLVAEHNRIIFGLARLPETPVLYPGLKETMILSDPPMLVGNHVLFFGLITPRNTQIPEKVLADYRCTPLGAAAKKAEVIPFPLKATA